MRKEYAIIAAAFAVLLVTAYMLPIAVSQSKARPLNGNFDVQSECMGGHEIFLYLDDTTAYDHCPGHRKLTPKGTLHKDGDTVTIRFIKNNILWAKVTYTDGAHTIEYLKDHKIEPLPQVNNPWRTSLPKYLSE